MIRLTYRPQKALSFLNFKIRHETVVLRPMRDKKELRLPRSS
jgi:hypothetical protein